MTTFNAKVGPNILDTHLPSQGYFEGFEERLANGQLRAETLNQVVSVREQEDLESEKPDTQRHVSLHLDCKLTIQSKRRFCVMRQPGRAFVCQHHPYDVHRFLDELLSERNFLKQGCSLRLVLMHGL